MRRLRHLALALAMLTLGCQPGPLATARPGAKAPARTTRAASGPLTPTGPVTVPQRGPVSSLIGKAKLIANPGGALLDGQGATIVGQNGASLISDQGAGIISNHGGRVVGQNGAAVVGQNGAAVVGQNGAAVVGQNGASLAGRSRALLQAAGGLGVYGLADAEVRLYDAAGRELVDEAGRPLAATTGPDASFRLEAVLPPGTVVARIRLWDGGELSALVVRGARQQLSLELSTASSLGATYVLGLAEGQQAVLDRLPADESARLSRELDVIRRWARGAFRHEPGTLGAVTAQLRERVPAVDRVAEDVRALLLGQARLGSGRPATEVALAAPAALAWTPSGLLIGEFLTGRLRRVGADGILQTWMDEAFGEVKANLPKLSDVLAAPDGTLYIASETARRVWRLAPGGRPEPWLGTGEAARDPAGPAEGFRLSPGSLTLASDGALWIGEGEFKDATGRIGPRLLAVTPDRAVRVVPLPDDGLEKHAVDGVVFTPDGALWCLARNFDEGALYRLTAGTFTQVRRGLQLGRDADLVVGRDGTLYLSEDRAGAVHTVTPDGKLAPVPGLEAGNALGLSTPGAMALDAEGRLLVADAGSNLIAALAPGEPPRIVAGSRAVLQRGTGTSFAINTPVGLTVDGAGSLLVAEMGGHVVRAFDGESLTPIAGSKAGNGGDGGPATAARLRQPTGLGWHAKGLWILDQGNGTLRRVASDGLISTVVGSDRVRLEDPLLAPGESRPAAGLGIVNPWGLAVAPDGTPYWTSGGRVRQVHRLQPGPDGDRVAHVLGAAQVTQDVAGLLTPPTDPTSGSLRLLTPYGLAFSPAGDLYVSDALTMQVYRLTQPGSPTSRLEVFAGRHVSEVLTALTGSEVAPASRDEEGMQAREAVLAIPAGLAFDAAGNLYVAEAGTRNLETLGAVALSGLPLDLTALPEVPARVRRITPDGRITTVIGQGGLVLADPRAEDALGMPMGLVFRPDGSLAIADAGNNQVRVIPASQLP
jgi:sugar lactone lactonase YvrE